MGSQRSAKEIVKALVVLFGAFLLVHFCTPAHADALFETTQGNIRLVVYSDKCGLNEITNLPLKAIWYQDGKEIEGCVGARDDLGVAVAYFADKTIAVLPLFVFRRLTST